MAGKTTTELIDELRPIFHEHLDLLRKCQWKELADVLNARGITMAKDLPWNDTSLGVFMDRYGSRFELREMEILGRQTIPPSPHEPEETPPPAQSTLAPVDSNTVIARIAPLVEDLEKMVAAWREEQTEPEPMEGQRPKFKRGAETSTRTVRLGNQLIKDAERYAAKHKRETGGTFSGLVELLLWERLGRSRKYLAIKQSDSHVVHDETDGS